MGIEPEIIETENLDPQVLSWPKFLLIGIYGYLLAANAWILYSKPMYEEEYIIRMIYMVIMLPLLGFIAVSHRWAMTNAFAVFLCFTAAILLFASGTIYIGSIGFICFLALLTWRSLKATDQLELMKNRPAGDVFE